MVLKFKVKKIKNWENLRIEQKVNLLKFKMDEPRPFSNFLMIFIWSLVFVSITFNFFALSKIAELRGEPISQLIFLDASGKASIISTWFCLTAIIFFIVDVIILFYYHRKWNPFLDSIKKTKEIRF